MEPDLDITPLSISELECFCFETKVIQFEDLDYAFKDAIETSLGRAIVSSDPAAIYKAIDHFNTYEIRSFIQGFCSSAEVGVKIKNHNPVDLDLWVEFRGATNEYVDTLPKRLKHEVMDKYLSGWRELVKDPSQDKYLKEILTNALKKHFPPGTLIPHNHGEIEHKARIAMLSTGIVDNANVRYEVGPYQERRLFLQLQLTGRVEPINLVANLS